MERLIFWQNTPSIHQAPLIRGLAQIWPGEVMVVTEWGLSEERLSQGWELPDFSPARLVVAPTAAERRELIRQYSAGDAVHIFSGLHASPETYRTLKHVSRTKATIGLFAEPGRNNDGLRALGRRLLYRAQGWRWGRRIDFVLATGATGMRWFAAAGFARDRLFPFGYFVKDAAADNRGDQADAAYPALPGSVRLTFVGQLVPWKGVDLLLHALARLCNHKWKLDVVGDGAQSGQYKALAEELGLNERVRWLGVQPNQVVRERMVASDALVLPSRFDGWRAVVNEALTVGTPAIVSDACGAGDLVRAPWLGGVFQSGSIDSLQESLEKAIGGGKILESRRVRIRAWALEAIAPDVAARYLMEVITHVRGNGARPTAPWHAATTCPQPDSTLRAGSARSRRGESL